MIGLTRNRCREALIKTDSNTLSEIERLLEECEIEVETKRGVCATVGVEEGAEQAGQICTSRV